MSEPVYEAAFVAEDSRYPMMVLKIDGQPRGGYYLNLDTLNFDNRVCVCNAHEANECCCGAFDYE